MNDDKKSISVSKIIDYIYCPRNIFYTDILGIPKNKNSNFKVKEGKNIHEQRLSRNKSYLRKDIEVIKKEMDITLSSKKYLFHGKLDELLFLKNKTAVPLDYKYSKYAEITYDTYKYQLAMYSMMIEENYKIKSRKGYIVFTRTNNKLLEIEYGAKEFDEIKKYIQDILEIKYKGYYPINIEFGEKCIDCCYQKLCNQNS